MSAGSTAAADDLRVATFNTDLKRDGPGLLLRDILGNDDPHVRSVIRTIEAADADIVVLTNFDFDAGLVALRALAARAEPPGGAYQHIFAARPNSGMPTGLDMDGDGRRGGPRDAQGWGEFAGQGGMAVLARFPIAVTELRDFSSFLWRDLPDTRLPDWEPDASIPATWANVQRLSSVAHWDLPVQLPEGTLRLLAYHATTPVFDGPEDRNGLRNAAETAFWLAYLDGKLEPDPPTKRYVIIGDANLDPHDGEGRRDMIARLLADPRIQDPRPAAQRPAEGNNESDGHRGNPWLDTADWDTSPGPGNLRVDYVLPSRDLTVTDAGLIWPSTLLTDAESQAGINGAGSRHALVWVDIAR